MCFAIGMAPVRIDLLIAIFPAADHGVGTEVLVVAIHADEAELLDAAADLVERFALPARVDETIAQEAPASSYRPQAGATQSNGGIEDVGSERHGAGLS